MNPNDSFSDSILSGFVNQATYQSLDEYSPQLLTNSEEETVKSHIDQELRTCTSFTFAVAFISNAVLTDLKVQFADLASRNVSGKILTSTYLAFNQPKVFEELLKIPNVEVRILDQSTNFHAKGYIFEQNDHTSIIIGSSNLTSNALIKNYEWNLQLSSKDKGALTQQIQFQIELQFKHAQSLTSEWIEEYRKYYFENELTQKSNSLTPFQQRSQSEILPNKMQKHALKELQSLRANHGKRGLIISATGTGKTYLGAFDVRNFAPKKFLFIVHREQILKNALASFRRVIGGAESDFGILSGNSKNTTSRYLFATIQSISRDENLRNFAKNEFDYILIDEAHKTGANSYQRVINYFHPDFLLGMTATPERTDDFNIYELFDHNVAYEIRLQEAIESNLLSQFHYIGITDYEYNGQSIEDNTPLRSLISNERMNYVEQQLNYYGYDGNEIHGLIFCSRKEEAQEIASIMTNKGYPTVALTSDDSISKREQVVDQFEKGIFDYIVTVDIFNEGIDIPKINQVVMLRNTTSSIIFIQQLGRGLRKAPNKNFVTIIDFIGNYKNNYLIPIALTGDNTRNKNNLRSKIVLNQTIGLSSINFSEIARERIFNAINNSNLTLLTMLRDSYTSLKNQIGRVPYLLDFQKLGSVDADVFVNKYDNYHQFLLKMNDAESLSTTENGFLTLISREFSNGMRIHELLLLKKLLANEGTYPKNQFLSDLSTQNTYSDSKTIASMQNHLNLSYFLPNDRKRYGNSSFLKLNEVNYELNVKVMNLYNNHEYFKNLVNDALNIGFLKNRDFDPQVPLTLYQKYTRRQVNRLIGWPTDQSSAIYGYREKDGICPIFVTYHKDKNLPAGKSHNNVFFNSSTLSWFTKIPRKLDSGEVVKLFEGNHNDTIKLLLFVKKNDDEGSDFYFMGQVDFDFNTVEQQNRIVNGKEKPVVKVNLKLRTPIKYDLYLNLSN